jgi:hypothetical protein
LYTRFYCLVEIYFKYYDDVDDDHEKNDYDYADVEQVKISISSYLELLVNYLYFIFIYVSVAWIGIFCYIGYSMGLAWPCLPACLPAFHTILLGFDSHLPRNYLCEEDNSLPRLRLVAFFCYVVCPLVVRF